MQDRIRSPLLRCALLAILLLCMARCPAWAEVLDLSRDPASYREALAHLIPEESASKRLRAAPSVIVLCRTTGRDLADALSEDMMPDVLLCGPNDLYTLKYASRDAASAAISFLNAQPWCLYAELDGQVEAADTSFNSWGARDMDMGAYLSLATNWSQGSVTVAVLDSGAAQHSFYQDRIIPGGYDYVDADYDLTNDGYGHGTHVTGILADCTQGTQVMFYPIRILNDSGSGYVSKTVAAIHDACDAGVEIINLSLVAKGQFDSLDNAVEEAVAQGVTVVIAAGNNACDASQVSPARLTTSGAIVVGSATRTSGEDVRSSFSNYGDSVDVYAYGNSIQSCATDGGFVNRSGTSMAAPHVSAACALALLLEPGLTPSEQEERIRSADACSDGLAVKLTPLIPLEEPFRLWSITLAVGDVLQLPQRALPLSCGLRIEWSVSGDALEVSQGGRLEALQTGAATLTAHCPGFDDCAVDINILPEDASLLTLPEDLLILRQGAFSASDATRIRLPGSLLIVEEDAFANCPSLRTVYVTGPDLALQKNCFGETTDVLLVYPCAEGEDRPVPDDLQYIQCVQ